MNSDAAGAELVAIENEIVALRTTFPRSRFEFVEVFFNDTRERMLRAHPALVAFAPFEKSKTSDPGEFPFAPVNQVELVAQVKANLSRHIERSVVVRNL